MKKSNLFIIFILLLILPINAQGIQWIVLPPTDVILTTSTDKEVTIAAKLTELDGSATVDRWSVNIYLLRSGAGSGSGDICAKPISIIDPEGLWIGTFGDKWVSEVRYSFKVRERIEQQLETSSRGTLDQLLDDENVRYDDKLCFFMRVIFQSTMNFSPKGILVQIKESNAVAFNLGNDNIYFPILFAFAFAVVYRKKILTPKRTNEKAHM